VLELPSHALAIPVITAGGAWISSVRILTYWFHHETGRSGHRCPNKWVSQCGATENLVDQLKFQYDQLRKGMLQNDVLVTQVFGITLALVAGLAAVGLGQTSLTGQLHAVVLFIASAIVSIALA